MKSVERIETPEAPRPAGAYSQGLRAGDLIFVAGQGPIDPNTGGVVGTTIEEQTEQAMKNVAAVLAAAGAELSDVVKATVHLSDLALFAGFDATYRRFFTEPFPVRTTVGSQLPGMLVEIDVVARAAPA